MAHHGNQAPQIDEYGNPIRQTDEYGNPVAGHTGHVSAAGHGTQGLAPGTGQYQSDKIGSTGVGGEHHPGTGGGLGGMLGGHHATGGGAGGGGGVLHRSGSGSSSSSEDDGQGGRRKKGMKEKIKEKMPGGHKAEATPYSGTTTATTGATGYGVEGQGQQHEKKGIMEKIKEKIPGGGHKGNTTAADRTY